MYIDRDTGEKIHPVHVELGHYAVDGRTGAVAASSCFTEEQISYSRYHGLLSLLRSTTDHHPAFKDLAV